MKTTRDKTPEQALTTLEWLCSKMERSTGDARRSLYRWGVKDIEQQDRIIAKLIENRYIDDSRYAAAYVRDKVISGRWGEAKIRAALGAKGVARETINSALADNFDSKSVNSKLENSLRKAYEKELPRADDSYKLRAKLFRRAAGQGFDIDTINTILSRLFNEQ